MRQAEKRFQALDYHNITPMLLDGTKGWAEQAPFDRIIVTASGPEIPQTLIDHLAVGGILVAPVGESAETQELVRLKRTEEGIEIETLLPVRFVPLVAGIAREL
jgi:protein-L-isoaspartate(D-aspartate) O-methyltransferase